MKARLSERMAWTAQILVAVAIGAGPTADAAVTAADELVDLEFRLYAGECHFRFIPGDEIEIGLYAVSPSDTTHYFAAADVIFAWDPEYLQLMGNDDVGGVDLLYSGFPLGDPYNLNEVVPPQDGNGLYSAWGHFGSPVPATPEGTLLTTFVFEAIDVVEETAVDILVSGGDPVGYTTVFHPTIPNYPITGELFGTAVDVVRDCPADVTGDGYVDIDDIFDILFYWGDCAPGPCPWDVNCDDQVDIDDIFDVLAQWGACP
ncbi:MAG: hypothetical protein JSV91_00115 [Phycisphaerales bacterium]|nr:MAG: hypothetical protein JSV91_00115 [Phycisphaerales bacterium]